MVFIPMLTHNCWHTSGCGYTVPSGLVRMPGRRSDYILVFAGTQHKQQQSISIQYHEYLLAYLSWLQIFLPGQKMVYVGIHFVLLNFYVFLPGH